jgi:hypothetical protein
VPIVSRTHAVIEAESETLGAMLLGERRLVKIAGDRDLATRFYAPA